MAEKPENNTIRERPPVIAIMGHVDHGKSTLLDYIRNSNIVAGEAGGITQHIAAYEVEHKSDEGVAKKITFIDTPGHAAFSKMRHRGARIADIAILIISAEDGIKAQTIEAIQTILEHKIPYVVALNKIDRPAANPEKIKADLLEHNVYLEGFGGDVPYALISAKTGEGVDDLLDTLLLLSELQEFTGDPSIPAEGFVIESHLDEKRGISATLIIKNGTLKKGDFVVAGNAWSSTRITEDHMGNPIESATFSTPIAIVGFNKLVDAGTTFSAHTSKREAEKTASEFKAKTKDTPGNNMLTQETIIPLVIKSDALGTLEAIESEIHKLSDDDVFLKIIKKGIGPINESDLQIASTDKGSIVLGFTVDIDKKIMDSNDADLVEIKTFSIIYKMIEWLEEEKIKRRPVKEIDEVHGKAKILKVFNNSKGMQVVGARVLEGILSVGDHMKIEREDGTVLRGIITNIEQARAKRESIQDVGAEFGMMIKTDGEIIAPDIIQTYQVVQR